MEQKRSVEVKLSKITVDHKLYFDGGYKLTEEVKFTINSDMSILFDKECLRLNAIIEVYDDFRDFLLYRLESHFDYYIVNFDKVVSLTEDGIPAVNKKILLYLNNVSLNTCRGIVSEHLRETDIAPVIIPLINFEEMSQKSHLVEI